MVRKIKNYYRCVNTKTKDIVASYISTYCNSFKNRFLRAKSHRRRGLKCNEKSISNKTYQRWYVLSRLCQVDINIHCTYTSTKSFHITVVGWLDTIACKDQRLPAFKFCRYRQWKVNISLLLVERGIPPHMLVLFRNI